MEKEITINNIVPKHVEALTVKLKELGVDIQVDGDAEKAIIKRKSSYKNVDIKTLVYPGFATDLQQPITPLLFMADGPSFVTETIYPARFRHVDELKIWVLILKPIWKLELLQLNHHHLMVLVYASDLRAGACLIIAGLLAEGVTTIYNVRHIYRGYTDIVKHLKELGANIWTEEV